MYRKMKALTTNISIDGQDISTRSRRLGMTYTLPPLRSLLALRLFTT